MPDGLVCTAVPPAPVGSATVEAVWTVSIVVSAALNRLLFASPKYAHRAQAVSSGTMATFNLSGRDRPGKVFGLHLTDPLAGGFGVFADHDGQNTAGPINVPCPSIADVEVNEQKTPPSTATGASPPVLVVPVAAAGVSGRRSASPSPHQRPRHS
ncbi:hypothetical protein TNCT6_56570 [Streptomyces sp. 6-11-2]|nr:hypothetical protein TNCT6_56570 [Streptomyces sp. 6-11-2]